MTANGSRKTLPILVAAILGVVVGYLIGRGRTAPGPVPQPTPVPTIANTPIPVASPTPTVPCGDQIVVVGPDAATLSRDPICIHPGNRVTWRSDRGQSLVIVFPESGFPPNVKVPPFDDTKLVATSSKRDWFFKHHFSANVEVSTNVRPELTQGQEHGSYKFKYDQILSGVRKDGIIIIQW